MENLEGKTDFEGQTKRQIDLVENEFNCDILKMYIDYMEEKDFSVKTINNKIRTLVQMSNTIGKTFNEITANDRRYYISSDKFSLDYRTNNKILKTTKDTYKKTIRTFYKMYNEILYWDNENNKSLQKGVYPDVVD